VAIKYFIYKGTGEISNGHQIYLVDKFVEKYHGALAQNQGSDILQLPYFNSVQYPFVIDEPGAIF